MSTKTYNDNDLTPATASLLRYHRETLVMLEADVAKWKAGKKGATNPETIARETARAEERVAVAKQRLAEVEATADHESSVVFTHVRYFDNNEVDKRLIDREEATRLVTEHRVTGRWFEGDVEHVRLEVWHANGITGGDEFIEIHHPKGN